jgi:cell division protein FtsN
MKGQAGSSRFDTVLKMLMISFISLLAFSSGVYFGREMTESDHKIKALEADFHNSHERAAEKNNDYNTHDEDALAAEDVEEMTDKYVDAERDNLGDVVAEKDGAAPADHDGAQSGHDGHGGHETPAVAKHEANDHEDPAGHGAAGTHAGTNTSADHAKRAENHVAAKKGGQRNMASVHDVKPIVKQVMPETDASEHELNKSVAAAQAKTKTKPDIRAALEAARRVANNETPSPANHHEEARAPSSLPKNVGTPSDIEYTVQIASYPTVTEAKNHANELVKKGFPAYSVEANIKGKTWYRVSIGSFKTLKEASSYRTELKKQAELNTAIVQKIER